jgi:hypothetical protein
MALNKTMKLVNNFQQEVIFSSTYIKIDKISGHRDSMLISINVQDKKDGVVLQLQSYAFKPNLDGKNFIAQAYDYLKTLPEFAGATDC